MNQININSEYTTMTSDLSLLAMETALLRYMISLDEMSKLKLENWIEINAGRGSFLIDLLSEYPEFGGILIDEMDVAKNYFIAK